MSGLSGSLLVLAVALALDRLVGDPPALWRRAPHPVVLIGRAIAWLDAELNAETLPFADRRRRGMAATLVLVVVGLVLGWLAESLLRSGPLGLAVEMVVVAVFLAHKSLVDHVAAVAQALRTGGVGAGRKAVAEIVGRDVTALDEAGISRAAIESAAENVSDGVIAPAFWFLLLGLPGLLAYKAVNTADSMIGHRSQRYEAFGWAAARLDDVLNFVPARFSALLIAAAAALFGFDADGARRAAHEDAAKHRSPNAGWPEAALAGALGLAFGGPRNYADLKVDGAWLNGEGRRNCGPDDIDRALRLLDATWALLAGGTAVAAIVSRAL